MYALFSTLNKVEWSLKLGFYREWKRWLMLEAAQLDGDLPS